MQIGISTVYMHMLNKSFFTGQLSYSWKIANSIPLHKKGSKQSGNNYKQISLTSIIVKVGKKIVKNQVSNFWLDQNIFNPNQYAYLSEKSTLTQLWSCFDDRPKARNKSNPTDVVFLDFSKAFDSVPHKRLLFKLKRYGIDDSLLLRFRNFLTNRRRVAIRGTYSSWASVKSGVPQGTILGPILFLIYVSDISTKITSQIKLYADDTKLYREISDKTLDIQTLQSDLAHLHEWSKTWQLPFNSGKCEVIRITHARDRSLLSYTLAETFLKSVDQIKDLGVTITKDLSWSQHVAIVVSKANKVLGIIK